MSRHAYKGTRGPPASPQQLFLTAHTGGGTASLSWTTTLPIPPFWVVFISTDGGATFHFYEAVPGTTFNASAAGPHFFFWLAPSPDGTTPEPPHSNTVET